MKMTLVDVINRQRILATLADKKLPYKLGYAIAKNVAKFQAEAEIIEKSRKSLIENYAVKDDKGEPVVEDNQYKIEEEKMAEFNAEFSDYMSTETDVEIFTVPESVLDADDSRFDVLTVAQIFALDFMIEK